MPHIQRPVRQSSTPAAAVAGAALSALLTACGGVPATQTAGTPAATAAPAIPATATVLIVVPTAAATIEPTPAPTDAPTPAAGPAVDARQAIFDAINGVDSHGPYRMTIKSSNAETPAATILVVPPDRMRIMFDEQNGTHFETVQIGSQQYNLLDGKWRIDTIDPAQQGSQTGVETVARLDDIQDVQALGTKTVNGVDAVGYSFTDGTTKLAGNIIWIGPNGAPVQMVWVRPEETGTFDLTYDDTIVIEAPAP